MTKPSIGYDIDGVFISDVKYGAPEHVYSMRRDHLRPLFQPQAGFILITSRPQQDWLGTKTWADIFDPAPAEVVVGSPSIKTEHAIGFKEKALRERPHIRVFVESDIDTVNHLRKTLSDRKIIHFSDFIQEALCQFHT
jgi:hypothetical protein